MKQFLLLFIVSIAFALVAKAQTDDPPPPTENAPPTVAPPKRYLVTIKGDTIRSTSEYDFHIFRKVLIEANYPGGPAAWHRFIKKNLVYPDSLKAQKVEGTVWLQFIVYREDGRICDLEFLSGNELLKEAALATMRRSPDWEPASANGRSLTAYRKLAIVFRLADVEDKPHTPSFSK